jgi:predicted peroxiredoxin
MPGQTLETQIAKPTWIAVTPLSYFYLETKVLLESRINRKILSSFAWIQPTGGRMARREFLNRLSQLAALPFLAAGAMQAQAQPSKKSLKIMMKSAWGSDDPTKAAFPFSHGLALSEAGHDVQIFLLGEAVSLMRKAVANSVTPVGWPPIVESLTKLAARKVPIYACGACSRARGVTEEDLANFGAKFGNPTIFVSLVEWADHIITE